MNAPDLAPSPFKRLLSPEFVELLRTNPAAAAILKCVKDDRELDLQLRGSYVDIYFRGFSVFQIRPGRPSRPGSSRIRLGSSHDTDRPVWWGTEPWIPLENLQVEDVLPSIDWVKRVRGHKDPGRESAFESSVVRDNRSPDSPIIVLDRQIQQSGERMRLDLLMYDCEAQRLVLAELKIITNPQVSGEIFQQLQQYQELLVTHPGIKDAYPQIYKQRVELGLASPDIEIRVDEDPLLLYLLDGYKGNDTRKGLLGRLRKAEERRLKEFSSLKVHMRSWPNFQNADCGLISIAELPTCGQWFSDRFKP